MITPMSKFLIVLGGPTASGKTAAGIELAKALDTEIISADSRQLYKETKIGTAVPTEEQLREVPHHFIHSLSLADYYNASMFEQDVLSKLEELFREKDYVLMVGGSGLYINAVCFGIDDLPRVETSIREKLAARFKNEGLAPLQEELKRLDPESYENIDLQNHYRVLKALEISLQTGRPYSSFLTRQKKERDFQIIRLAVDMEREILYERINRRVDAMIDEGLVEEVASLREFRHTTAMKTVGYREIFRHLDGELTLDEAADLIRRNTRKYARKQLTWFRKNKLYEWVHPEDTPGMLEFIRKEIQKHR